MWIRAFVIYFRQRSVARIEESMPQISVGESVRAVLQPDDKSMDFRDCADQRMMDVRVHGNGRYKQAQCCIDTVRPRNNEPC